jgi:hypothetical protein
MAQCYIPIFLFRLGNMKVHTLTFYISNIEDAGWELAGSIQIPKTGGMMSQATIQPGDDEV